MNRRALGTALARRLQGSALLHAAGLVCIAALVAFTIPVRAQSALLPSVQTQPTLAADQTAQLSNLLGGRFDGTQARHAESPQQGARIELQLCRLPVSPAGGAPC